jgi:hypothetical protein
LFLGQRLQALGYGTPSFGELNAVLIEILDLG